MPGKRTRPTDPEELKAFRKSGQRPAVYAAKLRAEMVFSAMLEHDGDRAKVAAQCGMTPKALSCHLARNPLVLDRYEAARAEIARKAVEIAGEQAMTKAEALRELSKTGRGQGEVWAESTAGEAGIVTLKRGPSFTEKTNAIGLLAKMQPGWLEEQRQTVTLEISQKFLALPADLRRELIATHGARAIEVWAQESGEVMEAALELPAP